MQEIKTTNVYYMTSILIDHYVTYDDWEYCFKICIPGYHVSRRSRQMFGGPPIQAICCRLFQSASSSSVKFFCT